MLTGDGGCQHGADWRRFGACLWPTQRVEHLLVRPRR